MEEFFQVQTSHDNRDLVANADLILLAVKPQNMKMLLGEIQAAADGKKRRAGEGGGNVDNGKDRVPS